MSTARRFDTSLVIRLLDLQVVGPEDWLLGKVDDVLLEQRDSSLVAVGIMVGPDALGGRYPGRFGRWWRDCWQRLSEERKPAAAVVPLHAVTSVSSAAHVDADASNVLLDSFGLENWLRRNVIARFPGAKGADNQHEPAQEVPAWALDERPSVPELRDDDSEHHRLSELLAMDVVTTDGTTLGRVVDVRARAVGQRKDELGDLAITELRVGPRLIGSTLGYGTDELSGPGAVRWVIAWLHQDTRAYEWDAVEHVSWADGCVRLRAPRSTDVGDPR